MNLILAQGVAADFIILEHIEDETFHNMIIPTDPNEPLEVLTAMETLGLKIIGWTRTPALAFNECVCIFTQNVSALVTDKGLSFLEKALS